ncbi:head GIN domain-containing protein [Roseateles cavernae]|uniref:head GIN domain-containing protein n=1 Tax=Roseateles cavernae TaxID=3153578 RepID=UPI0032E4914E
MRALLALLLAAGAQPASAQTGQLYTPGAFERLEVSGSAQVRLAQGERDQVFIVGNAQTQKNVQLDLRGDRLVIRPTGSWKFWDGSRLQIEVLMRDVRQLVLSGASDLHAPGPLKTSQLDVTIAGAGQARFDALAADSLRFVISGAGEGHLAGQVTSLQAAISGKGALQAERLRAGTASVAISGVGHASFWATEAASISVSGIGSVDYWGPAEARQRSSGMASVSYRGEKPPSAPGSPAP